MPAASSASTADSTISVPGAIDTPTQTVTVDGSEYEVSSLARSDHGSTLSVDVSTPSSTDFDVYLYNTDQQVELSEDGTGSQRVAFDTSAIEPGSYALGLYIDGNYVDYLPVVVGGYDVTTAHPTSVDATDSAVDIDVTITATAAASEPAGAEVAVWNGDTVVREPATHREGTTYRATISTADLTAGETYAVYAVAQGTEQVEGEPEALGVSDRSTLEVTASGDNEGGDGTDGDDDGTGGDDDGSDDDSTGSDAGNETIVGNESDSEGNETAGNESDSDGNETDRSVGADNDSDSTARGENASDGSVLQPSAPDSEEGAADDASDAVPSGAVPGLACVVLLGGLARRVTRE
ncbi:hypothetical protein [Natrinema sp. 1APR25-10V2]|uniref:hypothetical protein n=1 Tax=Natrinema sp. 1APR25-10V2 TaxID=2951081 RepID=UPI0028765D01|nr:hypothetical protein [Natrinema sp. 1APR25-10V2]MDS0475674.1 hypothetical protein [Natrinema sp. 1APR25-10V2]